MGFELLGITGPIYLLIGLGWLAARRAWMTAEQGRALSRFVAQFCVPALLIRTLSRLSPAETLQADFLVPYAAGSLLAMGIVLAVSTLALRRPWSLAAMQALGASSSNSLFIG
jgi:malonate transporter